MEFLLVTVLVSLTLALALLGARGAVENRTQQGERYHALPIP